MNNIIQTLQFDKVLSNKHFTKKWYDKKFALLMPTNRIVPFQVPIESYSQVLSIKLRKQNGGLANPTILDMMAQNQISVLLASDGSYRIVHNGNVDLSYALNEGYYYIEIQLYDSSVYYSDLFHCVDTIKNMESCYVRIDFDSCKTSMGVVSDKYNVFKQWVFIDAVIASPKYNKIKSIKLDNLKNPTMSFGRFEKVVVMMASYNEYLSDFINSLFMYDNVYITKGIYVHAKVSTFRVKKNDYKEENNFDNMDIDITFEAYTKTDNCNSSISFDTTLWGDITEVKAIIVNGKEEQLLKGYYNEDNIFTSFEQNDKVFIYDSEDRTFGAMYVYGIFTYGVKNRWNNFESTDATFPDRTIIKDLSTGQFLMKISARKWTDKTIITSITPNGNLRNIKAIAFPFSNLRIKYHDEAVVNDIVMSETNVLIDALTIEANGYNVIVSSPDNNGFIIEADTPNQSKITKSLAFVQ